MLWTFSGTFPAASEIQNRKIYKEEMEEEEEEEEEEEALLWLICSTTTKENKDVFDVM